MQKHKCAQISTPATELFAHVTQLFVRGNPTKQHLFLRFAGSQCATLATSNFEWKAAKRLPNFSFWSKMSKNLSCGVTELIRGSH